MVRMPALVSFEGLYHLFSLFLLDKVANRHFMCASVYHSLCFTLWDAPQRKKVIVIDGVLKILPLSHHCVARVSVYF